MKQILRPLICGLLITAMAVGGLYVVLHRLGFEDVVGITHQELNADNIIKVEDYSFTSGTTFNGVTVTYDDDGVITLNGQASSDTTISLGMYYILEDSYYTVSVFCDDEPVSTTTGVQIMYTQDNWANQKKLATGTLSKAFTFKNDVLQYVKVCLTLSSGDIFENFTLAPVMVQGKNLGTFYIEKTLYI